MIHFTKNQLISLCLFPFVLTANLEAMKRSYSKCIEVETPFYTLPIEIIELIAMRACFAKTGIDATKNVQQLAQVSKVFKSSTSSSAFTEQFMKFVLSHYLDINEELVDTLTLFFDNDSSKNLGAYWKKANQLYKSFSQNNENIALEEGKDSSKVINCFMSPYGLTLLQTVIIKGLLKHFKVLVQGGADVNAKDCDGKTALHWFIQEYWEKNLAEMTTVLLNKDVEINAKDCHGKTPLHYAAEVDYWETGKDEAPIAHIMVLLNNGADINAKDHNDKTPLHYALMVNWEEEERYPVNRIMVLLNNGADVHAKDCYGRTPLHYAVRNYYEALPALLILGADVNAQDDDGKTPLHYLAEESYGKDYLAASIRAFMRKGLLINTKDKKGKTPLHYASEVERFPVVVSALLDEGADLHAEDCKGRTPLHYAVKKNSGKVVVFLLAKGALINAKDKKDKTPLHYAIERGYLGMARLLYR